MTSPLLAFGLVLVGLGVGLTIGWVLGARRVAEARRELEQRKAELRSHVLPLLEHRASAEGVPPDRRARDEGDALLATIAIGRAIGELETRRDLPFTDTVEVSKDDIRAELGRRQG
ncbi:MAG: hypothetical protein M3Y87_13050 [Myxococcota bacterium]|nr:hypothetical protein [Myxococcota bacterium]